VHLSNARGAAGMVGLLADVTALTVRTGPGGG
jgi:hypothetical protein